MFLSEKREEIFLCNVWLSCSCGGMNPLRAEHMILSFHWQNTSPSCRRGESPGRFVRLGCRGEGVFPSPLPVMLCEGGKGVTPPLLVLFLRDGCLTDVLVF